MIPSTRYVPQRVLALHCAYSRYVVPLDVELSDGSLTIRPSHPSDRIALLQGRDDEFHRFLGEGSSDPAPAGCIFVDGAVIGWVDFDDEREWLGEREVNVGYGVFAESRGNGYATRALRLLHGFLRAQVPAVRPSLLIDPDNTPSLAVAARAGFEHAGDVEGQLLFRPSAIRS